MRENLDDIEVSRLREAIAHAGLQHDEDGPHAFLQPVPAATLQAAGYTCVATHGDPHLLVAEVTAHAATLPGSPPLPRYTFVTTLEGFAAWRRTAPDAALIVPLLAGIQDAVEDPDDPLHDFASLTFPELLAAVDESMATLRHCATGELPKLDPSKRDAAVAAARHHVSSAVAALMALDFHLRDHSPS